MSLRNSGSIIKRILLIGILYGFKAISIASEMEEYKKPFNAHDFRHNLIHCLSAREIRNCIQKQLLNVLESAVKDNSTWHYNDFLILEKKLGERNRSTISNFLLRNRRERSFSDTLAEKLLDLMQSRSLRFTLPEDASKYVGISDAVDDFLVPVSTKPNILTTFTEEGTVRDFNGLVDDKIEALSHSGRKKKDKDKNVAMMGGMVMMAMIAQMFLGKVILIAGAAFVMAKIALAVSVLGSLKKGSTGSSGSTTEHVIISGGGGEGGGHHHDNGWHRSMPYDYRTFEAQKSEHKSFINPSKGDEGYYKATSSPKSTSNDDSHSSYNAQEIPVFL